MTAQDRATLAALMASRPGHEPQTAADLVAALTARPAWQTLAACRGVGASVFFLERGARADTAKALCASCPVQDPCAAYAEENATHGIWASQNVRHAPLKGRR